MSRLAELNQYGQSFWLDNLTRAMLEDGSLQRRVDQQSLSGVTSNPAIFHAGVTASSHYDDAIAAGIRRGCSAESIYRDLLVEDIKAACDLLHPVFIEREGADGFASLEISPHLARDPLASLRQAQEFWDRVDRPNLLIKLPGTRECMSTIEELLYRGINVNITLLFGLEAYWDTFHAYMRAQERRLGEGKPLQGVQSVASLFLSRIDTAVDRQLGQWMERESSSLAADVARSLQGRTAIANAKLVYASFQALLSSERWSRLEEQGARPQRIVWASTGTKTPDRSDVMYIEPLIGPGTISTMPEATADAFDVHGRVAGTLEEGLDDARQFMEELHRVDIDFNAIASSLIDEGIQKFIEPYERLMTYIRDQGEALSTAGQVSKPLRELANRLRVDVIRMTSAAGSGHPTSALSCAEIMAALFFHEMRWDPTDPQTREADRFILSKGHAAPILWATLSEAGAIDEALDSLRRMDSSLEGHPTMENPWVPVATGSLGQGLSAANGMALANRLDGIEARIYCLMGDGECSEGSVWEAAQFASLHGLSAVVAIVDVNGLEQSGSAPYGHDSSVLAGRFRAFGWQALEVDGHDMDALLAALEQARNGGPTAILSRTQKGRGVSFLEGQPGWHGKALNSKQRDLALRELGNPEVAVSVKPRRVERLQRPAPALSGSGLVVDYLQGDAVSTRQAFGEALRQIGGYRPDLVVLDGDVKNSTRTDLFAEAFPERFFEAHIAEQNMLGTALGLAVSGKTPVAATFAAFLTRAYDFIRMAGHTRPPHLLICGSHAGISIGEDGASQMGLEDLAMFRAIDGCKILYPCDAVSAARLTELGILSEGMTYLRTTRGKTPVIYDCMEGFESGGSKTLVASAQDRLTLVAAGITVHIALEAHRRLLERGLRTRVIDAYSVKPLDVESLDRAARETGTLLVIEDHHLHGGLGDAVSSQIGRLARIFRMGVTGEPHSGKPEELLEHHHLSASSVVLEAMGVAA